MSLAQSILSERRTAPDTTPLNIAYFFLQDYILKSANLKKQLKAIDVDIANLNILRAKQTHKKFSHYQIDMTDVDTADMGWFSIIEVSFDDNKIEVEGTLENTDKGFFVKAKKVFTIS